MIDATHILLLVKAPGTTDQALIQYPVVIPIKIDRGRVVQVYNPTYDWMARENISIAEVGAWCRPLNSGDRMYSMFVYI